MVVSLGRTLLLCIGQAGSDVPPTSQSVPQCNYVVFNNFFWEKIQNLGNSLSRISSFRVMIREHQVFP